MSKNKYLMTAGDLCEYGLAVTNQLGLSAIETLEFINKFLAEHEYRERTCVNKAIEVNRMAPPMLRTDNLVCSACGESFFADSEGINHPIDWPYCPNCGAEVVS